MPNKIVSPRYLTLLSMLYLAFLLLSTVLVYKLTGIFSLTISTGTFVLPFTFWIGDIISEVYGYIIARRVIIYGIICLGIFDFGSYLFAQTPAPRSWSGQLAYSYVLSPLPRIFFADIVGFLLGSTVNVYLISRWRVLLKGKYFWLRSIGASFIGEMIFTFFVMAIIFFHHLTLDNYLQAAIFSIIYKVVFSIIASYPGQIISILLHNNEVLIPGEYSNENPFNDAKS